MPTVKISQLPPVSVINSNTANTLFAVVDVPTGVTGRMTATTLAAGLFSNNTLVVGNNNILLPNTIAQFSLTGNSYVQTNFINLDGGGTADHVITANAGTGTDSAYFLDLGYANPAYQPGQEFNNIGTAISPLDGYLYVQGGNASGLLGGNLIIGTTTTNTSLKITVGGGSSQNVVAKYTSNAYYSYVDSNVTGNVIVSVAYIFPDGTKQLTAAGPYSYANSGFAQANAAYTLANTDANNIVIIASYANSAYVAANLAQSYANSGYALANVSAGVDSVQNTNITIISNYANGAFIVANSGLSTATYAGSYANSAYVAANLAQSYANSGYALANVGAGVDLVQNTNITIVGSYANSAYAFANTINTFTVGVNTLQNTNIALAQSYANSAYALTNTAVQNTSTVVLNSLTIANTVTSNLVPNGSNTYNLGSATNRWGTLYLSGNSINILDTITGNSAVITVANSAVQVNNTAAFIVGNTTIYANGTIASANVTITGNLTSNTANTVATFNYVNLNNSVANNPGTLKVYNSNFSTNQFAVGIIGAANNAYVVPISDGTMLQITGKDGVSSKIINDAAGTGVYALFNGRASRGTANNPTALQSGDIMARFSGNGYANNFGNTAFAIAGSTARMQMIALENFTDTNKGTSIDFGAVPIGSNVLVPSIVVVTSNNTTFGNTVVLAAGNTAAPALTYKSGVLTTTAVTGAKEYDGTNFYQTPIGTQRGIVPSEQTYVLGNNYTLGANTVAQSLLGVGVTVTGGKRYRYNIKAVIQKVGNGPNAPTIAFDFSGTANVVSHRYQVDSVGSTSQVTPTAPTIMTNYITSNVSAPVVVTAAMAGGTSFMSLDIWGYIDVLTGGTLHPQISFSPAPTTSAYTQAFSSMYITPIGANTAPTSVGTWA